MTFTQNQQNAMASKARDIATDMQKLQSLCIEFSKQWAAGGWAVTSLTNLTGDNAELSPPDIVAMVGAADEYATWFDTTNQDSNAAKVARYE